MKQILPIPSGQIVFDEIHKYKLWRNKLKGLYDKYKDEYKFLVTGSARLDYYSKGNDSLQGRYHYHRLHPLSVNELKIKTTKDLNELLHLGGFPECFFNGPDRFLKRWLNEYRKRVVNQDLRDLEKVNEVAIIEELVLRLPDFVSSTLSINSLREYLSVAHQTISNWITMLEKLYLVFRVLPYVPPRIKALKKEAKLYFYNWAYVETPGARLENMVAVHLLKWCHYQEDVFGENFELRYYRDVEKREVDFVILKNKKPHLLIEVKSKKEDFAKGLKYLSARLPNVRAIQIHLVGHESFKTIDGLESMNVLTFLNELI